MIAHILAERQRRIWFERRVEADEQRLAFVDALKPVHPVGDRDVVLGCALALPAQEIPRCPGPPAFRHQSDVTMEVDGIWRVADGAENGAFAMVGVGKHRQRLVAVRCDHDVVVNIASAVTIVDDYAMRSAFDRGHGAAQPEPIPKGCRQFLDIASASALYGAPCRAIILQQAMIAEECDEVLGREVQHFGGRRGPDCRPHRREIIGQ
jgi:hypothetical protein